MTMGDYDDWFNAYDMCDTPTNASTRRRLREKYGDRLIKYQGRYYVKGEQPCDGQAEPHALPDGTPIRFEAWFMDDC